MQQLRQAEGHDFGNAQLAPLVEGHVEVDVHHAAAPLEQQDVVQMPVAQAQQVADLQKQQPGSQLESNRSFPQQDVAQMRVANL